MNNQPSSPSILKLASTAVIVLIPLIYGIIALNTGDLLWASPVFEAQPDAILVHCYGEDIALQPGTPEFEGMTNLVNQTLSGRKRWDDLSLSDSTYQDYLSSPNMMTLEVYYATTLRVHSPYKFFSHIDRLIIPLVGRHAQTNAVFGRWQNFPAAGSLHVESVAPLAEYLSREGLCSKP